MEIKITFKSLRVIFAVGFILLLLFAWSWWNVGIRITDAKMATALDEQLMPVQATDVFPRGTTQVYCWLEWKDARVKTQIKAKWHYVTDDIHILDYAFLIPRKEGAGGISLSMPEGKTFPVGKYRIDIVVKNRTLKTLAFKVK